MNSSQGAFKDLLLTALLVMLMMLVYSAKVKSEEYRDVFDGQGKDAITLAHEISSHAANLFAVQDFAALNQLDDDYRLSQARLPDGRWKITFIYSYLSKLSNKVTNNINAKESVDAWQEKFRLVEQWLKATPEHPAPYIAKAELLIVYAWHARGSGWAKNVSNEQWQKFRSRIAQARKVLEYSSLVSGNHPNWFVKMEVIAKAQHWSEAEFTQLYDSAVALYPNYYFIHFAAASYFQPRWHGSKKALRQFVENAVAQSKAQEGLTLYARLYWSQLWALKDNTFAQGYAQWPQMKQGFDDIMTDYPDSKWNLNAFAFYACTAKDWQTTKQLISRLNNAPLLKIWGSTSKYQQCDKMSLSNESTLDQV